MKKLILFSFVTSILHVNAQFGGYYGKKNYFDFEMLGNFPIVGLIFEGSNDYSKEKIKGSGNLDSKRYIFDYGFRGSFNRMMSNHFALGLEVGLDFKEFPVFQDEFMYTYIENGNEYQAWADIEMESPQFSTLVIMPKLTFCSKGSLLPIGISHEIGIGYTRSKIIDDDYGFEISQVTEPDYLTAAIIAAEKKKYIDFDETYGGMSLMYGIRIRTPLTKSLLLNYGFKYTLNLRNYFKDYYGGNYTVDSYYVSEVMGRTRILNFISFNLGLSLAL